MDDPVRRAVDREQHVDEPVVAHAQEPALVRLRLDLGYDGTLFAGWARQPGQRTVQGVVEEALATVLRAAGVRLTCAGRTDAGVHARGQVAHVDVDSALVYDDRSCDRLTRRLPGVLPEDVRVFHIRGAPPAFDARFSALSRRYAYRVSDAPYGVDPLRRHEIFWSQQPVDLQRMNDSTAMLLGEHDFAAFCRQRERATTVRTLLSFGWERDADGVAVATVEADAFCHNMVRALVGAVLTVGTGRRSAEWPAELLAQRQRDSRAYVVPAHGLTLEHVSYPPDVELGDRAQFARRRRTVQS